MQKFSWMAAAVIAALLLPIAGEAAADARLKQAAQHFVDLEDDKAKALLDALSAEGVADADVLLGYLHSDPLYQKKDYQAAVAAFERAAAVGSEEALFQLAESRYWPDYTSWTLTAVEEDIRPTAQEVFFLLQRTAVERKNYSWNHNASIWRLAWLCTFGNYDCGEQTTDEALSMVRRILGDNLRTIAGAFRIMQIQRSEEPDSSENTEMLKIHLQLGYAAADPFVAAVITETGWSNIANVEECPDPEYFDARGRLLALENDIATKHAGGLDVVDCYDDVQQDALRKDLISTLGYVARAFGNTKSWHLQRCFMEAESESFGDCLIHAVRHHYFACTRLSMPRHFSKRFDIEYRHSKRYEQCREMMLGYPTLYNKT